MSEANIAVLRPGWLRPVMVRSRSKAGDGIAFQRKLQSSGAERHHCLQE
ncbi:MAG: hypothetical protein K2K83_00360 [Rikenella sp.]|nr:hypothetical protein [Rikenella sp.]